MSVCPFFCNLILYIFRSQCRFFSFIGCEEFLKDDWCTSVFKVVIVINLEQKQKTASNAENTTNLPKILQVPSLCCFS